MKTEKITIWILAIFNILLLIILLSIRFYIKNGNSEKEAIRYPISTFEDKYKNQKKNSHLQVISDGIKLKEDLKVQNEDGESVEFNQLILKPVLVLRYSELNCQSCVDMLLNSILSDSLFNDNNILILSSYRDTKYLYKLKRMSRVKIPIFNIESIGLPPDTINMPYMFILDRYFRTHNLFIPDEGDTATVKNYLSFAAKKIRNM